MRNGALNEEEIIHNLLMGGQLEIGVLGGIIGNRSDKKTISRNNYSIKI